MRQFLRIALLLLALSLGASAFATTETVQPIRDKETLAVLREVQQRVEDLRGIHRGAPIPAFYLTSDNLRQIALRETEKQYPPQRRKAFEALLESLKTVPADFDLLQMILPLLDEQVGGLYDPETKRLYVRAGFDIVHSKMAELILAHEMCHALQDHAFSLKSLHVDVSDNDDLSLAGLTVAEGDAMLLTTQYVQRWASADLMKEMPAAFFMDQSALKKTPLFFQQQLLFPYVQGELLLAEASKRDPKWRDRLFLDSPLSTAQVIHAEKYFDHRDNPTSLALMLVPGSRASLPDSLPVPKPPAGYRLLEQNHFGELGLRLLFEDRLGSGIAYAAAEGWHGDAYVIYGDGHGKWWFCWESAWDTPADAGEFTGAWVTLWRSIGDEKGIGDPTAAEQTFRSGAWTVSLSRNAHRAIVTWWN